MIWRQSCAAGNGGSIAGQKQEDLALKSAAAYFGDELIHWLGIRERALRAVPTEMVELETRHMYEDFLYEMENGMYYHFEFESDSISIEDLRRFREYEASTARIYKAPVVTYVICSSEVKNLRDSITEGINTYRVSLIRERYSRLILLLSKENKNDLIVKIASDPQYREELYKQYGI